jgi:ligand-binding sensor domain-containing protein
MLSGAGGTTHPGLMTGGEITALCEDAQRILWVGTREEGIFLFDRSRASVVQHLTPSTDRRDCLQCGTILSLLRDHAGIVWLGTATAGAAKVVPDLIHFSDYRFGSAVHHNETVWSLLQTRSEYPERLLVGTTDGLYEFNGVSGGRKCLWRSTHQVRAFLEDSLGEKGALWVGTLGGGLVKLRPGASKMDLVKTYYTNRREDNESCIYAMIQDKAGTLWIGTNGGGLLSFSELTGTTVRHPMIADADTSTWAISLHQDQSGAIWAGTWKQPYKIFPL